jgi:ribosomal-protein-alanine N-acetyltransferase
LEQTNILKLARMGSQHHLHVDWYTLDRWLQEPTLIPAMQEQGGVVKSFVAAALQPSAFPDEAKTAWLRLIMPPTSDYRPRAMDDLWSVLRSQLQRNSITQISLLEIDDWVAQYAKHWGFSQTNSVITLRRMDRSPLPRINNQDVLIRDWTRADLSAVCQVDWAAFAPIWRYDSDALLAASQQSSACTVMEVTGKIAGYQMSTQYSESGHLARLAIAPALQGKGLGALLLHDVIKKFGERNIGLITVNTQQDNVRSQRLYIGNGFKVTGHAVPIWTLNL